MQINKQLSSAEIMKMIHDGYGDSIKKRITKYLRKFGNKFSNLFDSQDIYQDVIVGLSCRITKAQNEIKNMESFIVAGIGNFIKSSAGTYMNSSRKEIAHGDTTKYIKGIDRDTLEKVESEESADVILKIINELIEKDPGVFRTKRFEKINRLVRYARRNYGNEIADYIGEITRVRRTSK